MTANLRVIEALIDHVPDLMRLKSSSHRQEIQALFTPKGPQSPDVGYIGQDFYVRNRNQAFGQIPHTWLLPVVPLGY